MSDPVKQHIVPQCYLKQWVDPNTPANYTPYVWRFEKNSRKGKSKAPHNILTVPDLYTLEFSDGTKDYRVESRVLSRIEGVYASLFERKIAKRLPLSEEERVHLCAFVAIMLQRTIGQKENIEGFYDRLINQVEALEKHHNAPPKESLRLREEKRNIHTKTIVNMLPNLAGMLARMSLAFLCCENTDKHFITSDEPCQLFNPQLQWQRFYGPGLGQKHVEVTMALSPTTKVLFSWSQYKGYCRTTPDWVEETNRMIRGHTKEYFISNNPKTNWRWYSRYPISLRFMLGAVWRESYDWVSRKWFKIRHYGVYRR